MFAAPSVETAACPAETLLAVGEGKERGYKAFSLAEMVFGVLLVDACNHPVEVGVVSLEEELVVSPVAKGCSDDPAAVLPGLSVKVDHHLSVGFHRVADSVPVLNHKLARLKSFLNDSGFIGPAAVKM